MAVAAQPARTCSPNSNEFPDFDDNLRQAFQRETELFFDSIMREDRSVLDLLTADYTFVNERLARHYGIPDVYGSQFRRVTLTDDARRGLLGQGSMLAGDVARRPHVAGPARQVDSREPPRHAAAAAAAQRAAAQGRRRTRGKPLTMRERMEEHRDEPGVRGVPQRDGPARLRRSRTSTPSARGARDGDARRRRSTRPASWLDGTKVDGVVTLRQALLQQPGRVRAAR